MLEQTAREAFQENQETGFGSVAKNSSRVILHRMHAEPGTGPPGGALLQNAEVDWNICPKEAAIA